MIHSTSKKDSADSADFFIQKFKDSIIRWILRKITGLFARPPSGCDGESYVQQSIETFFVHLRKINHEIPLEGLTLK
jgi:hypothetical protein